MKLFTQLRSSWFFSASAAGVGFFTTLLTVHLAGAAAFANFTIDLAKLMLLVLVFELVPSPYAIFRVQQAEGMQKDLASFSMLGGIVALLLVAVMAALHLFADFSPWAYPYAIYLGLQRYLDVKLQAEGRLREYFQLTFTANLLRAILIAVGFSLGPRAPPQHLLWMALSAGSLASFGIWVAGRPRELSPFLAGGHARSIARLFANRRAYYPYYANVGLKRVRDAAMPVLCGILVTDRVEVARYLLAFRGLDFVLGQLRVAEALLNNLEARLSIEGVRGRQFAILAVGGQAAAFGAAVFLGAQVGLDAQTLITALLASMLVYPYVLELVRRSDAYAAIKPHRVTLSLVTYMLAGGAVIAGLVASHALSAPTLVLAPLAGQTAAALSYFAWRFLRDGRDAKHTHVQEEEEEDLASDITGRI